MAKRTLWRAIERMENSMEGKGCCYCKRRFAEGMSTSLNHSPKLEVSAFGSRDFSTPLNARVARDIGMHRRKALDKTKGIDTT